MTHIDRAILLDVLKALCALFIVIMLIPRRRRR